MRKTVVCLLAIAGCSFGVVRDDCTMWGAAAFQGELRCCLPPHEAAEERCTVIRGGGPLSPEGGKAIGVLGQLLAPLRALLPGLI